MYIHKLEKDIRCPLEYSISVFGGKWKSRIICALALNSTMRYTELKKELYDISDAMLANMLKELQDDDMVKRTQYNEIPPRVEYSLTEKGDSVLPILVVISEWGFKNSVENGKGGCLDCPSKYYIS